MRKSSKNLLVRLSPGLQKRFRRAFASATVLATVCNLLFITAPAYAAPSLLTLDSTGIVGTYTSIAIGADGFPVMSYEDQTNTRLKLFHCGNAACTSGNSTVTVDSNANTGLWNSLAIGTDGFPIIAYYDASIGLRVAHCGNADCSSGNSFTTLDSTGTTGRFTSIKIGTDNKAIISYYDFTNTNLKIAHCGNTACTSGNTNSTIDSSGYDGSYSSMAIGADGFPVISHFESNSNDLRILHCGNATCTSGNTATAVDTSGLVGSDGTIAIGSDNLPIVSYYDITNANLKVMHCGNAACSSGNTFTSPDTAGDVGSYTSIKIGTDSLPVISYYDTTNHDLKVLHCGNSGCTSGNVITTLDSSGDVGKYTSIAIGGNTFPVISYQDTTNTDLKLALCDTQDCAPSPEADVYVTLSIDTAIPKEGDTVVYTVTAGNDGPANATGVEVTDLLPAGLTYVSDDPSQGSYVSGTGVWTVGSLLNGASATLDITATVDAGTNGNLITDDAAVSASDQPDSNNANDSASLAKTMGIHTNVATVSNTVTQTRYAAGENSVFDLSYDLSHTITGTITVTFPAAFNLNGAFTAGTCAGGTIDTFAFNNATHVLTAEKHACAAGTVTLTGAQVTNPSSPGLYTISWTNDDPGYVVVAIVDSDQVNVSADVTATITFDIDTATSDTESAAPYSVTIGTLTTGAVKGSDESGINSIWLDLDTNASSGAVITVSSSNSALRSTSNPSDNIPSANGQMAAGIAKYGMCLKSLTTVAGSATTTAPFTDAGCATTPSGNQVGGFTGSLQNLLNTASLPVESLRAEYLIDAAISPLTPAHNDYADTLKFIATGTF